MRIGRERVRGTEHDGSRRSRDRLFDKGQLRSLYFNGSPSSQAVTMRSTPGFRLESGLVSSKLAHQMEALIRRAAEEVKNL